MAQNEIFPNKRFFNAISKELRWIYFEFQPRQIALRKANKYSREYHKAYYLEHAELLLSASAENQLTPQEIYDHPEMQNVLRYIHELKGKYKKRTITESWLPDLLGESKRVFANLTSGDTV